MQYRRFGSSDFPVSALGSGCMRLPTVGDSGQIDEKKSIRLIPIAGWMPIVHQVLGEGAEYQPSMRPWVIRIEEN